MDLWGFCAGMRVALYQCGRLSLALQGQVRAERKEPDSVHQTSTAVTLVDRLCQEVLLLQAHVIAPWLAVYSEELDACPADVLGLFPREHRYVLILDPLDGTDDYLGGGRAYAHMLGILDQHSGRMACGMVYFPADGTLYIGVQDMGAFRSQGLWASLNPVRPAVPPRTLARTKRLHETDFTALRGIGWETIALEGASVHELIRVTEGRVGAAVMRQFHGHDTAIAAALLGSSGGAVLDGKGEPLRYDRRMARLPLVILSSSSEYAREIAMALAQS